MTDVKAVVQNQHHFFDSGKTKDLQFRINGLKKLKSVLKSNEQKITDALHQDFRKPEFETYGTELAILYDEIDYAVKKLPGWIKPDRVRSSLMTFPSKNRIHYQPLGVVLVIGAWNFPVQLSINPAIGALAAGNCVVIKPSEIAPRSASVMKDIINKHFDEGLLRVIEGDAETAQRILEQSLDHIFFTGSKRVGKIVMEAAAQQLTPVTLELGGKSPAIVDRSAKLNKAAKRIAWGKFMNAGQTCVAPDYLYIHSEVKEKFIGLISSYIDQFYGSEPSESPDYPRIVDDRHFNRLTTFLDNGTIIKGGEVKEDKRYIAPTILDRISWEDEIMKEEIFGPILPVLEFDELKRVKNEINNRPEPLALYYFSEKSERQQYIVDKVPFGGGCINDTAYHFGNRHLPFGGIGNSGIGYYHGKNSFDQFSHKKSILKRSTWLDIPLRYAPYERKLKWLKRLFN